ncbi:phage virion morphogenesis protein [Humitalea sp. 24SJ18S-53]|uniref:phage virion morphogenesis protein n=1 Tax=Humitalea sp. 24SJ18S-53 TaxID=3422307 RepID=UPI003D66CD8A
MAGATLSARFDDGQVRRAFVVLAAMGRDRGVLAAMGVGLARNTRRRFDAAQDPDGRAWAPLNPAYAAVKKGSGILRDSAMRGGLQGSITSAVEGRSVVVGSNKIYAAVHQFGATITAKKSPTLAFRLGTALVRPRSVTIPARPYLGFSTRDEETVREVAFDALRRAMGG